MRSDEYNLRVEKLYNTSVPIVYCSIDTRLPTTLSDVSGGSRGGAASARPP